jgi:hypothetical protein
MVIEYLSIPTLTVVLYIIEIFSLIYYLILWRDAGSRSALHLSLTTMLMIMVNILGLTYSNTGNQFIWKIYLCGLSSVWPYFAYAVSVFGNPGNSKLKLLVTVIFFMLASTIAAFVFDRDILAFQASAVSLVLSLVYASYALFKLDKTIYGYGRLVGVCVLVAYALIGLLRGVSATFDVTWETHFYFHQTKIQSAYFLISVIFASLMPITIYVLHTEKSADELEKNALQLAEEKRKLEISLHEIKTLRGIIPICMHCKKIRNDDGFWEDVAEYLQNHSYADMSHGLCPDCMKEKYPKVYEKLLSEGKLKA